MKNACLGVLALVLMASCTDRESPTAATTIAGPTPILATPSLPTTVPGVLSMAMPVEVGDSASSAFGITPFGIHGDGHAANGHTGWDIEYRLGGVVRAAAAGTVLEVLPDAVTPTRFTVQLEHVAGTHFYRTIYTNLETVPADVAVNEAVRAGQPLGTAGSTGTSSSAMTHFQLDDFEYYRDVVEPNAVSPEPFLSASAKTLFDALWARAAYSHELVEPFVTNPRDLAFPASRTWMRAGGDGPAGIRFTRRSARTADYEYALLAESGTAIEVGTVTLIVTARPLPSIDLVSTTARRLGAYDIVSNELRLSLSNPGESRPADLSRASVYRTTSR